MKIAIATDAWHPQSNGVVTTLGQTIEHLRQGGHEVRVLSPQGHRTLPLPSYPEIRIALFPGRRIRQELDDFEPDCIHIATEGPIGSATRRYCLDRGLAFTTAYHTQFPEYLRLRLPVPLSWSYAWLRRFHAPSARIMVPTPSQIRRLESWRFRGLVLWSRGVDSELFRPDDKDGIKDPRPILLYTGRVAVEKNIEAFLALDHPGTKYVIGDGPAMNALRKAHPQVRFTGLKKGRELARLMAAADVFVFPSRTDTFGLVMLEAMACGVPVAAYPVQGPIDVVEDGVTGALDEDLGEAVRRALQLDGKAARAHAQTRSWAECAQQFLSHLEINERSPARAADQRSAGTPTP